MAEKQETAVSQLQIRAMVNIRNCWSEAAR